MSIVLFAMSSLRILIGSERVHGCPSFFLDFFDIVTKPMQCIRAVVVTHTLS